MINFVADEEEILMLKQFQNIPSMDEQILSQISKDNDHTINDHSIGDVSGITQINCEVNYYNFLSFINYFK